jgi:hypothetical protein
LTTVCDLSLSPVNAEPFSHLIVDEFIEAKHYKQLCDSFPNCPPQTGPSGFSLYWGDPGYQMLLDDQPAWDGLFKTFHSQLFIDWCREQFAEVWKQEGCRIDLSEARYVPYREDRIDKERAALRKIEYAPHELWVRMDIHQGRMGYERPVHVDHARRLMSMLVYMYDHAENEMSGGELLLHVGEDQTAANCIKPRHNLMIAFPCSNRSYHSVSRITAQKAPRNYIQVHISSSVDVWPRATTPAWRRRVGSLKRRLKRAL